MKKGSKRSGKTFNMSQLHNEHKQGADVKNEASLEFDGKIDSKYTDEFEDKCVAYNATVTELDPKYTGIVPNGKILVRCFVKLAKRSESGLIEPITRPIGIPTQAGIGEVALIDDPLPYSSKAVIIAAATDLVEKYSPSKLVILSDGLIKTTSIGRGMGAGVSIPSAFSHPDLHDSEIKPQDPQDRNYGYLMVNPYDILGFLPNEED